MHQSPRLQATLSDLSKDGFELFTGGQQLISEQSDPAAVIVRAMAT